MRGSLWPSFFLTYLGGGTLLTYHILLGITILLLLLLEVNITFSYTTYLGAEDIFRISNIQSWLTQKHTTSSLAKTSIEEDQNTTVFAQKLLKAAKS